MYVVMNRLSAPAEFSGRVEQGFAYSTPAMRAVAGFVSFRLLRADGQQPGQALYIAETTWQDEASYTAWRSGDAFERAHGGGAGQSPLQSTLEVFTVVTSTEE